MRASLRNIVDIDQNRKKQKCEYLRSRPESESGSGITEHQNNKRQKRTGTGASEQQPGKPHKRHTRHKRRQNQRPEQTTELKRQKHEYGTQPFVVEQRQIGRHKGKSRRIRRKRIVHRQRAMPANPAPCGQQPARVRIAIADVGDQTAANQENETPSKQKQLRNKRIPAFRSGRLHQLADSKSTRSLSYRLDFIGSQ